MPEIKSYDEWLEYCNKSEAEKMWDKLNGDEILHVHLNLMPRVEREAVYRELTNEQNMERKRRERRRRH